MAGPYLPIRGLNRNRTVRIGNKTVRPGHTTIVDFGDAKIRKELAHFSTLGAFHVAGGFLGASLADRVVVTGAAVTPNSGATVFTVTVTGEGGTYTLSYDSHTTAAIAEDATGAQVEAALVAAGVTDDVTVTGPAGGPHVVSFTAGTVLDLTADDAALTQNEIQTITIGDDVTDGTYTVTGTAGQSAAIAWDASAAALRTGVGQATTGGESKIVVGHPSPRVYNVEFVGTLGGADQPELTLGVGSLIGGTATIDTTQEGGAGEVVIVESGNDPTKIDVATGKIYTEEVAGEITIGAESEFALAAANATDERIDIVQVNVTTGAVTKVDGTPHATTPVVPPPSAGNLALATVYRHPNDDIVRTVNSEVIASDITQVLGG